MCNSKPIASAVLVVLSLLARPALAQQPDAVEHSTVPFELGWHFLVVLRGQVGTLDHLRFILDTGTTITVVDETLARKLHLRRQAAGSVINFDRRSHVDRADLPDLRIGKLAVSNLHPMVARLTDYSTFGKDVDGILGLDFLSRCSKFEIDYDRRTVSFEFSANPSRENPAPIYFYAPLVLQGRPIRVVLDTGLQGMLLYSDRVPNLTIAGPPSNFVMGRLAGLEAIIPGLNIAGREVRRPILLMKTSPSNTPPGADGVLGPAFLNAKHVEFDLASNIFRWY